MKPDGRPPSLAIWLLRAGGAIAPPAARPEWMRLWCTRLENLWVLAARGELPLRAGGATLHLCADALASAFWLRFERTRVIQWMQGPGFILAAAALALALIAVLSRGFQATRGVILAFIDWEIDPRVVRHDARAELVIAHFVPILLALTVGAVLVAIGRLSLGRYGWRYWLFLSYKLLAVMVIIPLVWIEGNAALRAHLAVRTLSLLFGWLAWTLAFLGAFGCGVIWSFTDQRRRCPVCLRRLAMPVTLGSWASVFEPVTTEMLCGEGHGALCMDERDSGAGDRWIALDSSWRGL